MSDGLRRLLGAGHDRVELCVIRDMPLAVESGDVQRRDLLLGPADRVVDDDELALELLHLGELDLIGFRGCAAPLPSARPARAALDLGDQLVVRLRALRSGIGSGVMSSVASWRRQALSARLEHDFLLALLRCENFALQRHNGIQSPNFCHFITSDINAQFRCAGPQRKVRPAPEC